MKIRGVVSTLLAGALLLATSVPSTASEVAMPSEDIANIRSELSAVGIESEIQDQLISKLENGIPWDSLRHFKPGVENNQTSKQ